MKSKNVIRRGTGVVYHYTSLDTFMKILDGIKDGYITFHGSDIFTMNDPTEFYHGYKTLLDFLPQIENDFYNKIKSGQFVLDVDTRALDDKYRLSESWDKDNYSTEQEWIYAQIKELHESYKTPFVVSFSCQRDFLPMWSTYGGKGHGVALGIDVQPYYIFKTDKNGEMIFETRNDNENEIKSLLVSYDTISLQHPITSYIRLELKSYLQKLSRKINNNEPINELQRNTINYILYISSALIKNKVYSYEEESRLIMFISSLKDVHYKINGTQKVIPYIQIKISIEKLKKLVIGPCCDFESTKLMVKTRLKQLGLSFPDDVFLKSNIPYRNM